MKILIVHNQYIHRGGEDVCVDNEISLLRSSGIEALVFRVQTTPTMESRFKGMMAPWGLGFEGALEQQLKLHHPDVMHVHNLFPLLSPRIFGIARKQRVKTALTLHNFRPLCLNGLFLTPDLEVCERCAGKNYRHGIVRGCYRNSALQSAGIATHLSMTRRFYSCVDQCIAPSEFLRDKYLHHGWFRDRIIVQGHCIQEFPKPPPSAPQPYVLYLGRLSEEKGLPWLLELFREPALPFHLRIAGDGPLRQQVERAAGSHIQYLGFLTASQKEEALRYATVLVLPSTCFENFPLAVMEANAWGTPALVSHLGGLAEIVQTGENGMTFEPLNGRAFWHSLSELQRKTNSSALRQRCKNFAQERFSASTFLRKRLDLYKEMAASACVGGI